MRNSNRRWMPRDPAVDPAPLSRAQLRALVACATRELAWGLRAAARELGRWRALAESIPDAPLREDALHSLTHKRGHADGAALVTSLPGRRSAALLRAAIAYEMILDYLDDVSERHPTRANGQQLHQALVDAVDPAAPIADYYRFHPWRDDGGYLVALVNACRDGCRALPSYERVHPIVRREARRALVLGLNHEPDSARRDAGLRAWAAQEFPEERELSWFELSGAASSSLLVHVLLALAAEPTLTDAQVAAAYGAHWPWIALTTTMLDSYVDQADDEAGANHSYVAHYPDAASAVERMRESLATSMQRALALPDGHHHAVVVGCMIALFLSKRSARTRELRPTTRTLVRSGGSLVRLLLPILRIWRLLNRQGSS